MPLEFEFFSPDDTNYYAVVSRGNLIYSYASSAFVTEGSVPDSRLAIPLTAGYRNRLYASIPSSVLTDGVYVVRIYRGSYQSPSTSDELISMDRSAWSESIGSQIEPSNSDNISDIIALNNIGNRGYAIKLTGSFARSSAQEVGLCELFISKELNKCFFSVTVSPKIPGISYNYMSIRTNDSARSQLQEVLVNYSNTSLESSFIPSAQSLPYLLSGNFIWAVGSSATDPFRIAGNPENKVIAPTPGTPVISFERSVPNTGISFRSV